MLTNNEPGLFMLRTKLFLVGEVGFSVVFELLGGDAQPHGRGVQTTLSEESGAPCAAFGLKYALRFSVTKFEAKFNHVQP